MTVPFFQRLEERVQAADSLLCVGLDPHSEFLASSKADEAYDFCRRIIESTSEFVCAYKPNSAFFEAFGASGMEVLKRLIDEIPDDIPVILDAKRGDIASTARAYAHSVFEVLRADAVTLSPYLGRDSLEPFLRRPERGVFMLCKTSNPGARDLQEKGLVGGEMLYVYLARKAVDWNQHENLGLVVGATDPEALAAVRRVAPDLWILAPGVGAQGGDLESALQAGLREDGRGLLVPVSRSISQAAHPGTAARDLQRRINDLRRQVAGRDERPSTQHTALASDLLKTGCVRFGSFKLKSGITSPIYIDLRLLASNPVLLSRVARAYLSLLNHLQFELLAALPYAALPIGTTLSLMTETPMIYPRKEIKDYGTRSAVEGVFSAGQRVVVIDDLVTTGGSKLEGIQKLSDAGLIVEDVVVLIDREGGAGQALARVGCSLHSVFALSELLEIWRRSGMVSGDQVDEVKTFLRSQR
jgi:uridine monophosphate synthetase